MDKAIKKHKDGTSEILVQVNNITRPYIQIRKLVFNLLCYLNLEKETRQTSGAIQNAVPLQDFTSFSLVAWTTLTTNIRNNHNSNCRKLFPKVRQTKWHCNHKRGKRSKLNLCKAKICEFDRSTCIHQYICTLDISEMRGKIMRV